MSSRPSVYPVNNPSTEISEGTKRPRWLSLTLWVAYSLVASLALVAVPQPVDAADAATFEAVDSIAVSATTGEKPQSKTWEHDGSWWAVMPSSSLSGTWLWKLGSDGSWTNELQLSTETGTHADVKRVGDVVHILLYDSSPELVSLEYVTGSYQPWSSRPTSSSIALPGSETATLDIDSTGRMWIVSEDDSTDSLVAYYGDSTYSAFTGPITIASGIADDDIGVVTALPDNSIGVLWSNQNTERFGFKIHADGADPATWSADEVPASQSAENVGLGMADDHLNVAVASDGTLYAAVKTSYDTSGYPKIALLVRQPGGSWDDLYPVDESGTRGIAILNESDDSIRVVYTSSEGANDLVMKTSSASSISFGARETLISGSVNDATATKELWSNRVLVLAAGGGTAEAGFIDIGSAPDLSLVGHWEADEGSGTVLVDSSVAGNDAAISGDTTWVPGVIGDAVSFDGIWRLRVGPR